MKLTDGQAQMVADNHSLIYWYINMRNLSIDEYYDLFAIELCKTVLKYDEFKGSLSYYFKLRCDNVYYKEYLKTQTQKRFNRGMYELKDYMLTDGEWEYYEEDKDTPIILNDMYNSEFGQVIKLKNEGYSQTEIGLKLGMSQAQVSRILRKVKEEYESNT